MLSSANGGKAMNPSACFNDIIKRLGEWGARVDENHEDLFFFFFKLKQIRWGTR